MKRLLTFCFFLLFTSATLAGSVTLNWTPPTENEDGTPLTDLREYHIYYGTTQGGPYPTLVHTNAAVNTWTIDNLAEGTYCFVATALNDADVESVWSNEACKTVGPSPPNPPTGLTIDPQNLVAYTVNKLDDAFLLIPVGEAPVGTACDPDNSANGHFVIPVSSVTMYNIASQPPVVVANCS